MRALPTTLILVLLLLSIPTASANTKIGTNITGVQWVNATNLTGEGSGITNILMGNIPGLQSLFDWINGTHNAHVTTTTGIHGVGSGDIVGTTLPQNLTNKTLTNPIVTGELTLPGNPSGSLSAVPKQYVDALIAGLTWKDPITLPGVIDNSLTSPPVSPATSDAYIISSPATGNWTGLENHLVEWNGSAWTDFGTISVNTRLGISIDTSTVAAGSFSGKDNQILTVSSVSPYTYSYTSPTKGDAFFIENSSSVNAFYGYVYGSDGSWHKFSRVSSTEAGLGLSFSGNTLNVGTDNSNHITISADGIDVGSDVLLATGSYSNPDWLTSFAWTKLSGVPITFPNTTLGAKEATWDAKQNALGFPPENSSNKGIANGYAPLGADTKIPTQYYNSGTTNTTEVRESFNGTAPIAYNSVTGIFSCIVATGSVAGCLSSTDWNTFTSKVDSTTTAAMNTTTTNNNIASQGRDDTNNATDTANRAYAQGVLDSINNTKSNKSEVIGIATTDAMNKSSADNRTYAQGVSDGINLTHAQQATFDNATFVTINNLTYVLTNNGSYVLVNNNSYVQTNNYSYQNKADASYVNGSVFPKSADFRNDTLQTAINTKLNTATYGSSFPNQSLKDEIGTKADGVFSNATFATISNVLTWLGLKADSTHTNATFTILRDNDTIINRTFIAIANATTCSGTDKSVWNGTAFICTTDQTGASSGAPTTSHYLIDEPDSSLPNATVIPNPQMVILEEFQRKSITDYYIVGTESVPLEHEVLGTHQWTTTAVEFNDALVTLGDTVTTTDMYYNGSDFREFQVGLKVVNNSAVSVQVGQFNTSSNLRLNTTYAGYFFNFTNNTRQLGSIRSYWNASACSQNKCTTVNTTVEVFNNSWQRMRISKTASDGFVRFYINESQVANITTTMPIGYNHTAIIGAWVENLNATLATKAEALDYVYYKALR